MDGWAPHVVSNEGAEEEPLLYVTLTTLCSTMEKAHPAAAHTLRSGSVKVMGLECTLRANLVSKVACLASKILTFTLLTLAAVSSENTSLIAPEKTSEIVRGVLNEIDP
jgi:hypothetical protein